LGVTKKGEKAAEMAAVVQKEIFKDELGDRDTLVYRAKETREATYANAKIIEDLMMAQIENAKKDPREAYKAATAVKMLSLAASALDRLHATKLRALGLDREDALPDDLPVLTFRDLTSTELEALREPDEGDEENDLGCPLVPASTDSDFSGIECDEAEQIIVEGEEHVEPEKPRSASVGPHGGRLVREQLP
jgi:hypothetical protein